MYTGLGEHFGLETLMQQLKICIFTIQKETFL